MLLSGINHDQNYCFFTRINDYLLHVEGGTTGGVAAASEEESVKRSEVATYDPQRRTPSPTNTLTPSFPPHTQVCACVCLHMWSIRL